MISPHPSPPFSAPRPGPSQPRIRESNFAADHPTPNQITLFSFPFYPECSTFAFLAFAISRSNIPCVTRRTFAALDLSQCVNDQPKA